ncbi:DUF416 family protein [Bradyrhizobium manausense]|uniref:DUF416 family protein n=1 Tax=Bradyrhizobium manausense TaxID=989370 RepID=UPI001BA65A46|nr:DUF416 family protein [Bradyrhizobium manausense]MBR1088582.1 DUF416 family protein [Bradyrhizobium manausense]
MEWKYSEYQSCLELKLAQLPSAPHRSAFILSCCERQLPNYAAFQRRTGIGDSEELAVALEQLWDNLSSDILSKKELTHLREKAFDLAPRDDLPTAWTALPTVGAAIYACSGIMDAANFALKKGNQSAIRCGLNAYETVKEHAYWESVLRDQTIEGYEHWLSRRNTAEFTERTKELANSAADDPRTQREINKQFEILRQLQDIPQDDLLALTKIREVSTFGGMSNLGYAR